MPRFGDFSYGFDEDIEGPTKNGLGGGVGAQVGSQTGGSGAGLPVTSMPEMGVPALPPGAPPPPAAPAAFDPSKVPQGVDMEWAQRFHGTDPGDYHRMSEQFAQTQQPKAQPSSAQQQFSTLRNFQSTLSQIQSTRDPNQQAALKDNLARGIAQTLQEQGHDVKFDGDQIIVDGRPYVVGGNPANAGRTFENWAPNSTTSYKPGEIGMGDIPNFSFESLMQQMGGPVDDQTAALVSSILSNPESMGAHVVDSMKARSKDELAELHGGDMDRLRELGVSYGIQDSPWLAAEEMEARGRRNNALVGSNREIDIEAARTNFGDRLNAAGAGTAYSNAKAGRVQSAASLALSRAAATGDRLALRESVNQEAARLGIAAEQVMANYISEKAADASRRWGLQLEADKIAMMDRHFQEELAFKLEQLDMLDQQFGASHDLNLRQQEMLEKEQNWRQSLPQD